VEVYARAAKNCQLAILGSLQQCLKKNNYEKQNNEKKHIRHTNNSDRRICSVLLQHFTVLVIDKQRNTIYKIVMPEKKPSADELVNYYILLTISGEEVPTWLIGSLILTHFISPSSIDVHIVF
jgi:hypothetical protein